MKPHTEPFSCLHCTKAIISHVLAFSSCMRSLAFFFVSLTFLVFYSLAGKSHDR